MRSNTFLSEIAGKASSAAVILLFAAGLFISTGCNKKDISKPPTEGERQSGFVRGRCVNERIRAPITASSGPYTGKVDQQASPMARPAISLYSYNNVTDVVGGKGWNPGSARTIGYNVGALSGSYNFVGIYGWTTSPLIEYYVAEKGSMTGGTYVNYRQ